MAPGFRPLSITTAARSPQSPSSYSRQGSQTRWGSPRSLGSTQHRPMRPLSSFRNRTKPCRVTPDSKPIRNSNADRSELAFLGKNCKDSRAYAVSIWNRAFADSGTKLRRVSGTSNINQKEFRIGLHTLSAWPRPSVVWILMNAIRSKAKAPLWVGRWQSFRRFRSYSFQDPSPWLRPCRDCAPKGLDRPARPRIEVGRNWLRRQLVWRQKQKG